MRSTWFCNLCRVTALGDPRGYTEVASGESTSIPDPSEVTPSGRADRDELIGVANDERADIERRFGAALCAAIGRPRAAYFTKKIVT